MTRLIAKAASDAAQTATDRAEQSALIVLAAQARNADSGIMTAWGELVNTADICSGQSHGRGDRGYTLAMNGKWEQLGAPAAEAF
ncbi:MAG: hypothetical protein KBS74_07575 [Clostridiales bacterium]|nr:hypothetical protein [Candidatus Cacconaster stercorequi]